MTCLLRDAPTALEEQEQQQKPKLHVEELHAVGQRDRVMWQFEVESATFLLSRQQDNYHPQERDLLPLSSWGITDPQTLKTLETLLFFFFFLNDFALKGARQHHSNL